MHSRAALLLFRDLELYKPQSITGIAISSVLSNPFEWDVILSEIVESPWKDGIFKLRLSFPEDYNDSPPSLVFTTIPFHPNVSTSGVPSLPLLLSDTHWSPTTDIFEMLLAVRQLLLEPCIECAVNRDALDCFLRTPRLYYQIVRDVVVASQRFRAGMNPMLSITLQKNARDSPIDMKPTLVKPVKPRVQKVRYEDYYHSWQNMATTISESNLIQVKRPQKHKRKNGRASLISPPDGVENIQTNLETNNQEITRETQQRKHWKTPQLHVLPPESGNQVKSILSNREGELIISRIGPTEHAVAITVDRNTGQALIKSTHELKYGVMTHKKAQQKARTIESSLNDNESDTMTLTTVSPHTTNHSLNIRLHHSDKSSLAYPSQLLNMYVYKDTSIASSLAQAHPNVHPQTTALPPLPTSSQLPLVKAYHDERHETTIKDEIEEGDDLLNWSLHLPNL